MQSSEQEAGAKCRDSTNTLLLLFLLFISFMCCIMLAVMLCKIGYLEKAMDGMKFTGAVPPTYPYPLQPPPRSELFNPYAP